MDDKDMSYFKMFNSLKTDDFIRFLDRNNVTTTCAVCTHEVAIVAETMKIAASDNSVETAFATLYKHETAINTIHPQNFYYKLHCEKCGFITTFTAPVIFNWLQLEQLKEESKDDANER
ncbi:hypothetical protein [Erwinia sp. S38]|uniref:hypothetical protein n=1 Tax=Erwinia sp. S38 TaxID=2769338 RepID=UPI00190A2A50|nr:hypothetical protein [Erwinia sp. S38]MBK0002202.1 hypothetical protein [Erwinia sp. S38]